MADLVCWSCGGSLAEVPRPITRHMYCPDCSEVLHCCRMCRWYAPGRPGDCDHDRAEPPVEKEGANFCEYFAPRGGAFESAEARRKDQAKSRLSSLFDSDESSQPEDDLSGPEPDDDDPKSRLDDLFKD